MLDRERGPGYRVFMEPEEGEKGEEFPPVTPDIPGVITELRRNREAVLGLRPLTREAIAAAQDNGRKLDGLSVNLAAMAETAGVALPTKRIELIPYERNLLGGTGIRMYEPAPFTGLIKVVTIHWPAGCWGLVDVAVWHGNVQLCPRVGFLALNDTTPTYEFNEPVPESEEIWVHIENHALGAHRITVTVSVKET